MRLWWPLEWVGSGLWPLFWQSPQMEQSPRLELSAGAMDSDGFREVRNGVRSFVCVISVRGLSSLYAWLCGSVGIFATSLGFVSCFRKPLSISQVNFVAWRPFHSLEVISQPRANFVAHFAAMGVWGYEMALVCQGSVSQGVAMGLLQTLNFVLLTHVLLDTYSILYSSSLVAHSYSHYLPFLSHLGDSG